MSMKFCPNHQCVAYRRIVYTQSTRCALCRWDLKPPRLKSETIVEAKTSAQVPDLPRVINLGTNVDSPEKQKPPLRILP